MATRFRIALGVTLAALALAGAGGAGPASLPWSPVALAQDDDATASPNDAAVLWLVQRRPPAVPPAPGAPSVAAVSETALSVAWTPPDGASDVIDYDIQYRTAASQAFADWLHTGLATRATLTGLAPGTRYAVRVRAGNGFGAGDWSRAAFGRTAGDSNGGTGGGAGPTDPPASNAGPVFENPSAFSVAENTTFVGALNASDANDTDVVTGYSVVGGADQDLFRIDPAPASLRFANAPDFERPVDAAAENRYAVTVRASSGAGARTRTATQAITVTVTDVNTEAPGRPAPPRVTFDSPTAATAAWTAPANMGPPIIDYDVRFRRSPGDAFTNGEHVGAATGTTLSSTVSGWSFEVAVRASNDEGTGAWSDPGHGSRIELPEGFTIRAWAEGVTDARSMALGAGGTLFVGTRSDGEGRVYALRDEDGDLWAERTVTLARGLNRPNGVAFRDGDLYVAENSRLLRYTDIETRLDAPPRPQVVTDAFPTDRSHGWKFIRFGPDGHLYVPVGAPCNICLRDDPYASIGRLNVDTGAFTVVARGVRNTVGFDWHPQSGELWFTDNGRDWMGDDRPPDELNRLAAHGGHFGYPYCHGADTPDPDFDDRPCSDFIGPVQHLGPHVAALGMRFYTGDQFPAEYRNQVFIAEHGSWNRSSKIGYRVMLVRLDGDRAIGYEPFATGWLQGESNWGRPVDVLVMPDGALLVSDDQGGIIYRIGYSG